MLADLYPHVVVSGLFAPNITRVAHPLRLNQQHRALLLRAGFVLDTFGYHEHLTGRQRNRSISELDGQLPIEHDKDLVGGMPGVVAEYLREPLQTTYQQVSSALLQTYRDDFGKYANQVKHLYLQKVLDSAPRLVGQRYKYVNIDHELRSRELKEALLSLVRAGLIHRICPASGAGLPLAAYSKDHLFKILFLDVGLMQHVCGLDATIATATDFLAINTGAVAEQFVEQELLAYSPAYEETALFFWQREQRNSQAEVDYLISIDGKVIPVEVKAGKTGRLRSLKQFMTDYDCPLGVRISQASVSFQHGTLSVPLYAIDQLPRLIREVSHGQAR